MTFEHVVSEHLAFTSTTFTKSTSVGALKHAKREINEVIADIKNKAPKDNKVIEYADIFGCITDSANREGISFEEILIAWHAKLQINKERDWKYNGDGSYSHIK